MGPQVYVRCYIQFVFPPVCGRCFGSGFTHGLTQFLLYQTTKLTQIIELLPPLIVQSIGMFSVGLRIIILTWLKCVFHVQALGICWRRNTGATGLSAFSFGFVTRPELASFSSEHFFKLSCDSCLLWASCTVIWMFVV